MEIAFLALLLLLAIQSVKAISYLLKYLSLIRFGTKTNGEVESYEASNSFMIKNSLVPKITFSTQDGQIITTKPIYSWFVEFNKYGLGKSYEVFYDRKNPNLFVAKIRLK